MKLEPDDEKWLRKQLHSHDMHCRQCELVRVLLEDTYQHKRGCRIRSGDPCNCPGTI